LCSALVLCVIIAPLLGTAEAQAARPEITAVVAGVVDRQVTLIIDLPGVAQQPLPPESFSAKVHGSPQGGQVGPVLSDELAVSFVIDASESGLHVFPDGARGVGTFLLAQPSSTRSALVVDASPPAVEAPLQPGPTATLRALTTVRPQGGRATSDALDLAVRELPPGTADPRHLVLYTGAADAGGEPAADLANRLHAAGVPLSVVAAVGAEQPVPQYWSAVAGATGGVAVAAPPGQAIAAFDRLAAALGSRYLMRFPVPSGLPANAVIRVETPSGALSSTVLIPAVNSGPAVPAAVSAPTAVAEHPVGAVLTLALGVGLLVLFGFVMVRRRGPPASTGRPPASPGRPGTAAGKQRSAPAPPRGPWNIPARPELIVGRDQLLAKVRSALDAGDRVLLHGPDDQVGVGVTTAMIEFAHRHRDRYDLAWLISAEDPTLVPDRLAELAVALGLARPTDGPEPATARLLEALSRRKRWLLVFDNAEGPRELERFLPGGPGDVIVISQQPGWREKAVAVLVPRFTRSESVALLRSRLPYLSAREADPVGGALDDLPLAVGPAAAMLADTGMSVHSFLRQLSDRREKLRLAGDADSGPLAASWAITFDRLRADDPAALALLNFLAWLAPDPVPLGLLTRHPDELPAPLADAARDPAGLAKRAALLHRRGVARFTAGSLRLHPVPAAMLVARTAHERSAGASWPEAAVRLLRATVPDNPREEPASWPEWRRLLPHVLAATDPTRSLDGLAAEVGWLLGRAAAYLQARGAFRTAAALFEDADNLLRRGLGADHPDTIACARNLAANRHAMAEQEPADGP
jgi:hypothetical protein